MHMLRLQSLTLQETVTLEVFTLLVFRLFRYTILKRPYLSHHRVHTSFRSQQAHSTS